MIEATWKNIVPKPPLIYLHHLFHVEALFFLSQYLPSKDILQYHHLLLLTISVQEMTHLIGENQTAFNNLHESDTII